MTSPLSPRSQDFHPISVKIPEENRTGATVPSGSAIFSQSESDVDEPNWKYASSQEDASVLYSRPQRRHKTRTLSASEGPQTILRQRNTYGPEQGVGTRSRRMSHDEHSFKSRKFLVDVEETMKLVLEQEDTDANFQAYPPPAWFGGWYCCPPPYPPYPLLLPYPPLPA
ncbi:alpha,alpha-trehalase nth1 [Rhodotorula toruloides]|uniref:Uncharacterized protein n=2 Tax=Rhodotorula toruloides TaxID=5286 RepID=A0A2T0AJ88_RHOTO|nr:hypothetical protein AAT19DRAFT_9141 [Rhodotorula toruloides]